MAVIFGLWSKSITIIICIMQQCRWTNEEYVMIQSVWDSTNTASKHVMISTWLHIWWEEQKPMLWFVKDPDHTVSLASYKRTDDPSAAIGKGALWVRDQVNILKNCCRTRNPHNKYWSAISPNWQRRDWCGCSRESAEWMAQISPMRSDSKALVAFGPVHLQLNRALT